MKLLRKLSGRGLFVGCGLVLAAWLFSGCASEEPVFASSDALQPVAATTPAATGATGDTSVNGRDRELRFHVGDTVRVVFSGTPDTTMLPHEERIKEDGTITLPYIGSVIAEGKTPGDLQKDIHALYVPKYFKELTVIVSFMTTEQVYYVSGEVKVPNRYPYLGETTVLKAIQSAGDFTDYAKKTAVQLTRAGSKKPIKIDCKKALQDPSLDLPVFPGDKIHVPRKLF
jgi:polysaccharide export outer membrane protein